MSHDTLRCVLCRDWLWPLGAHVDGRRATTEAHHWFALVCHYILAHPVQYRDATGMDPGELFDRAAKALSRVSPQDFDRVGRLCAELTARGTASEGELVALLHRMTPAGRVLARETVEGAGLAPAGGDPTPPR